MKQASARLAAASGLLLAAACADLNLGEFKGPNLGLPGTKLDEARQVTAAGSELNTNLYNGYLALAEAEYREADYGDSDVFAERAMRAGAGEAVEPEAIEMRDLPNDMVAELAGARAELVKALAGQAATRTPAVAARAQVMFDCWMQEQEENNQPGDIEACRSEFMSAMAALDTGPPVAAERVQPVAGLSSPYLVFFDLGKDELSDDAKTVLTKVVADARVANGSKIVAAGHADRVGSAAANAELSRRRVEAVRTFLLDSGLEKDQILSTAFGEARPVVATEDGQAEAKNRRVEVFFAR